MATRDPFSNDPFRRVAQARCPRCGAEAPPVVRGLRSVCPVCGADRLPTSVPVNVAGKPSKVGGTVAFAGGVMVIVLGLLAALLVGAIFQAIFPAGIVGWAFGMVIAAFSLAIGGALTFGGRKLKQAGDASSRAAIEKTLLAYAKSSGGVVVPAEAAPRLGLTTEQTDAFLTELAKRGDGVVSLEVEDSGRIVYLFRDIAPRATKQRFAIDDSGTGGRVRVEAGEPEAEDQDEPHEASRTKRKS